MSEKTWRTHTFNLVHEVTGEERTENHVLPDDDLERHLVSLGATEFECKCGGVVEYVEGGLLFIHNAFDGREIIEELEAIQ